MIQKYNNPKIQLLAIISLKNLILHKWKGSTRAKIGTYSIQSEEKLLIQTYLLSSLLKAEYIEYKSEILSKIIRMDLPLSLENVLKPIFTLLETVTDELTLINLM